MPTGSNAKLLPEASKKQGPPFQFADKRFLTRQRFVAAVRNSLGEGRYRMLPVLQTQLPDRSGLHSCSEGDGGFDHRDFREMEEPSISGVC